MALFMELIGELNAASFDVKTKPLAAVSGYQPPGEALSVLHYQKRTT